MKKDFLASMVLMVRMVYLEKQAGLDLTAYLDRKVSAGNSFLIIVGFFFFFFFFGGKELKVVFDPFV